MALIDLGNNVHCREEELHFDFVRSSGPGGQNVNKVATAVQLRFDVLHSPSLPDAVRIRLIRLAGKRLNRDGVLVIDARRYRSQERNRDDAIERLRGLVERAAQEPKVRRPTRPTRASRERRLGDKKRRGDTKRMRGTVPDRGD